MNRPLLPPFPSFKMIAPSPRQALPHPLRADVVTNFHMTQGAGHHETHATMAHFLVAAHASHHSVRIQGGPAEGEAGFGQHPGLALLVCLLPMALLAGDPAHGFHPQGHRLPMEIGVVSRRGLRSTLLDGGNEGLTLTGKGDVMVVGTSSGETPGA